MRSLSMLLLSASVMACGGSSPEPATPAPPPPPAGAGSNAATGQSRVIDATPDVPLGKREVRDAELAEAAGKIVDAFQNSDALWTKDGKRLVFTSTRDGLPQLYGSDAAKPESPAGRLFSTRERISEAVLVKDDAIVFASDHGADENFSIFKTGSDGNGLVELTPDAKLDRESLHWAEGTPDVIYYAGRSMKSAGTTVYSASLKGPAGEKTLWTGDLPGSLTDVSRDGARALVLQFATFDDFKLLSVPLGGAGKPVQIYPAAKPGATAGGARGGGASASAGAKDGGKVTIFDAKLSGDGKRVYVGTDAGGEQAIVLALDASTGKELARYAESKPAVGAVENLEVAKAGNTIAVTIDAGNHREVRLLDATTLKPRSAVELPLGFGLAGKFTEDGKRLAVTWSTPAAPGDIFVVDVATGKVSPLRKDARPGFDQMAGVETSIVSIDADGGGKIPTNVYLPTGAPPGAKTGTPTGAPPGQTKKLPVIVSFHGGPAGSSAIRWSALARFYLAQGYAWVEPNVRGSTGFGRAYQAADDGAKRLDAFKDIEAAGTWVTKQPWADKDRVVIFGGSYGGYSVLVGLTRQPTLWRAGVDLFGVVNLKSFMATTSGVIRKLFLVEFGDPDNAKDAELLESISPLKDVNKIARPLFVYAGANDPRVPRTEDDQIVVALRTRAIPVEYMVKDDEGHSLSHRDNIVEFLARSARFLEHHLAR